jgi:hypothetical protein
MQHKHSKFHAKDLTGELFDPHYLISEGGVRPVSKGAPNGLESTENRRSVGRHGNQHVYVRDPQVSGSDTSDLTQVDLRAGQLPDCGIVS